MIGSYKKYNSRLEPVNQFVSKYFLSVFDFSEKKGKLYPKFIPDLLHEKVEQVNNKMSNKIRLLERKLKYNPN